MSRIIGRTNEVYSDEVPEIIFLQVIDANAIYREWLLAWTDDSL